MASVTPLNSVAAKDARAIRTREALRNSMLRLLQKKPLDQITIRDIAAGADINYATFFRHHATKDALLHEIAQQQVRNLAALMLPSLDASDLTSASHALCTYVAAYRSLWSTLLTGGAAGVLREELLKTAQESAVGRASPTAWVPAELAISFHVSGTVELLTWWLRQARPVPIERVAKLLEHIVLAPITEANRKHAAKQSVATSRNRTKKSRTAAAGRASVKRSR